MSEIAEISVCTPDDYAQVLDALAEFWDGRDVRALHHPIFVHEFGNSAFVIRDGSQVMAYLFGFVSQTEPVGYVHLVAVRASARRRQFAQRLYNYFVEFARQRGCKSIKAITTPTNARSIPVEEYEAKFASLFAIDKRNARPPLTSRDLCVLVLFQQAEPSIAWTYHGIPRKGRGCLICISDWAAGI